MPRSEEVNRQIREDRRAQIIQVAARVFARRGYGDTRISDIAEAGEMSQGLIYRYFNSKEDIFAVLIDCTTSISEQLAGLVFEQPGTAWQKLSWLTEQLLPLQFSEPDYSLIVLQTFANQAIPTAIRELSLSRSKKLIDAVHRLISEGQQQGEINQTDPEQLTFLYFSTMQGAAATAAFLERPSAGYPDSATILKAFQV